MCDQDQSPGRSCISGAEEFTARFGESLVYINLPCQPSILLIFCARGFTLLPCLFAAQTCVTLAMQLHAALTCESHSCTLPPSQASSPTALGPTVPPPRSFSMEEDKNDNGSTSPPQQTSVGHRARHPPWAAPMATRTSLPANFHISSFDVGCADNHLSSQTLNRRR